MPSMWYFMFMYLISFIVVMSSEDWFMVWLGLEINMMSFLILIYKRYDIKMIESCMKYFFIQSLGSALMMSILYLDWVMIGGLCLLILSYKVGAGPFFYWFPSVCGGLDWLSCYMLMFFQKFLPLGLIYMFIHWFVWILVLVGLLVGVLGSFNQSNIKELLAYSSIHHLGWIMLIMMKGNLSWMLYLLMYGLVLFSIIHVLILNNIIYFYMMYKCKNKIWFILGMLSMAGMPPLLGFFLKWMALMNIMNLGLMYVVMLVLVSVIMLYIYIRMIYDVIMGSSMKSLWIDKGLILYGKEGDMLGMMGLFLGLFFMIYIVM
uniref:NADH-ubiquinone oxidoreductase chain 2 n=1 Tax=Epeus alboguttatus TaxID=2575944 RepID=A0A4P8DPF4_9ARAC|nr:NADH dehydrogenase subunit 2 [Epeus alboguttatus]QCL18083.1 NADH dehydrogenase subunit 2 [Epeus alboguttatus]